MYYEAIEYLCMDDRHHRRAQLGTDRCDRLESVEALFGIDSLVTRIVYLLVGLSGLYLIFLYPKIASRD